MIQATVSMRISGRQCQHMYRCSPLAQFRKVCCQFQARSVETETRRAGERSEGSVCVFRLSGRTNYALREEMSRPCPIRGPVWLRRHDQLKPSTVALRVKFEVERVVDARNATHRSRSQGVGGGSKTDYPLLPLYSFDYPSNLRETALVCVYLQRFAKEVKQYVSC